MDRFRRPVLHVGVLAFLAGCGMQPQEELPSDPAALPPAGTLQRVSFVGLADAAAGRLQIQMGPQASLGVIAEDADGNPLTVAAGTAQISGTVVNFASGGLAYPAACNPGSPQVMYADVEVFSGFTEQLRNVYARMTAVSGGQTFCSSNSARATASALTPNVGTYLYQPLDGGAAPSAIKRTVQWAMNLPDNGAYWFTGELWAEVIPQPPSNLAPADAAVFHTGGASRTNVALSWTDDPLADGTNPEGYVVARPLGGASLTVKQCGSAAAPFDPATCRTTIVNPRLVTGGSYVRRYNAGSWYQWSVRSSFLLPGKTTRTLGGAVSTRAFSVVRP